MRDEFFVVDFGFEIRVISCGFFSSLARKKPTLEGYRFYFRRQTRNGDIKRCRFIHSIRCKGRDLKTQSQGFIVSFRLKRFMVRAKMRQTSMLLITTRTFQWPKNSWATFVLEFTFMCVACGNRAISQCYR